MTVHVGNRARLERFQNNLDQDCGERTQNNGWVRQIALAANLMIWLAFLKLVGVI